MKTETIMLLYFWLGLSITISAYLLTRAQRLRKQVKSKQIELNDIRKELYGLRLDFNKHIHNSCHADVTPLKIKIDELRSIIFDENGEINVVQPMHIVD